MRAVLISTYDLGRQPFGLASPAAWLREAGIDVTCADLSRDRLPEEDVASADLIGFFLPMHTATRLAIPVIDRVRTINSRAPLCAYGLYAPLTERLLREHGVGHVLAGEFEADLLAVALPDRVPAGRGAGSEGPARLDFRVPDRQGLPPLNRYAALRDGSDRRTVGYTEASRGCKHRCRHCPIVPVYEGRFRVVPVNTVMADVRAQVAAGARHITFGDPDFFNGIGHAVGVVEAFGRDFPGVTYDVTIKIEHLLQHAGRLPLLRETGCAFVTSAVESLNDDVLRRLEKGHTRADFERVVEIFNGCGLRLSPTFVAFTPWTSLEDYCELLHAIDTLGLVEQVAPIQLAIRLLVTSGSRLLELDEVRALIGSFDARSLTYPWRHPDARVDKLQHAIEHIAGVRLTASRAEVFDRTWHVAHEAAGLMAPRRQAPLLARAAVPHLDEPWYC